ncbi:HAMP domain-containing histidine kinase [Virgibacillus sp. MSP4-1]|uniref:sensor histidine kinase n=1 Tax=Virgibacillus sp. MSP4-1 TaxID=2700081 RepID=UPI00039E99C2|nr:ATP-binding protein [Virgibacillus sp. MSP4-1]QHS24023.1 HAMP domain-containing histidine kinase [Virgibacillus sp. MSP4-1]
MKLKTKIQVYATLVLLITILCINTAIFLLFNKITVDAEVDRVKAEADTLMESLATNMNTGVNLDELLKAYVPNQGIVRIINDEEQTIHTVTKKSKYYNLSADYIQKETHAIVEGQDGMQYAVISTPMIWENGEVVTLQVAEELINLEDTMSTLFYVLLFASLIMVVPALIGARVLSNSLLRPIQRLTNIMTENAKQGQMKKIRLSGRSKDELHQMSSSYNQMIDRLRESFTRQEQFVSDASHELKTPISVIKSYTQLLNRWGRKKPEVFEEATEAIQTETDRMDVMIRQMLTLARNQKGDHLKLESVNLTALLQDCVRAFSVTYDRNIQLFSTENKLEGWVDREKINQVFYILIDNACKYSQDEVHVYIDSSEGYIQVKVQDFGEGIPEADVERIFDRFYRVDKARSRDNGGTGLGLSIAKYIVESHNGMITVDTELGNGTAFTVKLPNS